MHNRNDRQQSKINRTHSALYRAPLYFIRPRFCHAFADNRTRYNTEPISIIGQKIHVRFESALTAVLYARYNRFAVPYGCAITLKRDRFLHCWGCSPDLICIMQWRRSRMRRSSIVIVRNGGSRIRGWFSAGVAGWSSIRKGLLFMFFYAF